MKKWISSFLAIFLGLVIAGCASSGPNQSKEINVYTARHYESDKMLFEEFSQTTGIKVNVISGKAPELIERIKREGAQTPADLFITVDGGVLSTAKNSGILQPITSKIALENIPSELRDPENHWIGLTTRARVIVYSKDRVKPDMLSTYEDLSTDKWKNKVLARPSTTLYDQSLLSSMIDINGEEKASQWVRGYVNNFARSPEGNDRDQVKAIAAGTGDVAIVNTYYVGLMLHSKNEEEVKAAQQIGIFFPNQSSSGTHINVSGIGLVKNSKNKANAEKLIEYLTSVPAQEKLTNSNFEYPANRQAKIASVLAGWGTFITQKLDFAKLGELNGKAIQIFTKEGWK